MWNDNPSFVYSPSSFLDTLDGVNYADSNEEDSVVLDSPPPIAPSSPTATPTLANTSHFAATPLPRKLRPTSFLYI
jgi:hypothetical protein